MKTKISTLLILGLLASACSPIAPSIDKSRIGNGGGNGSAPGALPNGNQDASSQEKSANVRHSYNFEFLSEDDYDTALLKARKQRNKLIVEQKATSTSPLVSDPSKPFIIKGDTLVSSAKDIRIIVRLNTKDIDVDSLNFNSDDLSLIVLGFSISQGSGMAWKLQLVDSVPKNAEELLAGAEALSLVITPGTPDDSSN